MYSQRFWTYSVDITCNCGLKLFITPPPIGSVEYCDEHVCLSVCTCVCLGVCLSTIISPELHVRSSPSFLCMLPMAVTWSFSGGVVICYVHPVLWMTLYLLHISWGCSTSPPGWGSEAQAQPKAWRVAIPLQAADARDYFLQSGHTGPQWVCWIFDIMFAHNVPTYIATRKWRVLKVTPQVATRGAESAVYDCLVG